MISSTIRFLGLTLCIILLSFSTFSQTSGGLLKDLENVLDIHVFMDNNNLDENIRKEVACQLNGIRFFSLRKYENTKLNQSKIISIRDSVFGVYSDVLNEFYINGFVQHRHEYYDDYKWECPSYLFNEAAPFSQDGGDDKPLSNQIIIKSNSCTNADFEQGDLSGWSAAFATNGGEANLNPGFQSMALNANNGNHSLMGPGAGMDVPSGNAFPRVFPGGGDYSLRLGNQQTGFQAAQVSYTFNVTPDSELFLYHFAVVMQDPGHGPIDQPYFRINLIIDGQNIECGEYFQISAPGAVGFLNGPGSIRYRPWTTVSIALTDFIGQTATIVFTAVDCSLSGHYGYAYLDAECRTMPFMETDTLTCDRREIELSAPDGAVDYIWIGPGIVGPNNTQNVTVNQAGVYTVTVIPVSGPQCAYVLETEIIDMIGAAVADFAAIDEQVCFGQSIQFNDLTQLDALAGNIIQWSWDMGNGQQFNSQNVSYNYPAPGTYDVELAILTDAQCADTIMKTVVVSPMPVAAFSVDAVCQGSTSVYSNSSSVDPIDGNVISTWTWTFGDGGGAGVQNPTHIYGQEGGVNVNLTVQTNNGCSHSFSTQATVWPNPVVNFSPTEVCSGFATNFNDLSTISNAVTANNIVQWNWNFGDGNTSNQQNPVYTYSGPAVYNAALSVQTNNGCVGEVTLPVTVHPQPVADFMGINLSGCSPICPEIWSVSTVDGQAAIVNYVWSFSDGSVFSGPSPNLNICFENNTSQTIFYGLELTVTTEHGCVDTYLQPNYISVFHNPIAAFLPTPPYPDILWPEVTFNNLSQFADYYQWTFFGHGQSNLNSPIIFFPDEPAVYQTQLIAYTNEGCSDTAYAAVEILDRIIFYVPNTFTPDKDDFNEIFKPIFSSGFDPYDFHLTIFNRWGEIIFESFNHLIGWDGTYGTNSNRVVKDGTYIWKLEFGETMSDKRHIHHGHVNVLR